MQTKPNPSQTKLASAIATRNEAREKVAAAKSALERGQKNADAVLADVQRHERAIENTQVEHAQALERFIVDGTDGEPPAYSPDAKVERQLQSSRSQHGVVSRALGALKETVEKAEAALATAEKFVRIQVENVLYHEAIALAAEIDEHDRQSLRLRERLVALDGTLQGLSQAHVSILPYSVLQSLERKKADPSFGVPIPQYASEFGGDNRVRILNEANKWAQRIAELSEGTGAEASESPKAA